VDGMLASLLLERVRARWTRRHFRAKSSLWPAVWVGIISAGLTGDQERARRGRAAR